MIRKFLLSTSKMTGAVAIRSLSALLLNKLIAVFAGPSGITLFSHLQNLLAIVIHLPQDGINKGYIRLYHEVGENERKSLLRQILLYNFLITIIPLSVTIIAYDFFWGRFGDVQSIELVIAFFVSSFFIVWSITLLSHFQALRKFGTFSIVSSIIAILILLTSGLILYLGFSFSTFLITYLSMQAFGFFITYLFYFKRSGSIYSEHKVSLPKDKKRLLFEYVLMAASVLFFTYLTDFLVRNYAIDLFGVVKTGLWQAVVRLSDYYKALFTVVVGAVFYAELTARLDKPALIKIYFRKILMLIVPLVALGLLLLYLLRIPVLQILFAEEFISAAPYLPYQLAGDFFGLTGFLFAYLIMAEKRTWTFIAVQGGSTICYLILIYFFTPHYDLDGIVMAHFYRNIFFLLLVVVVNKKVLV